MREAQEREKNLEARMQEEIRRQVQIAVSASKQESEPGINISQSAQLKSCCASTEIPNQGDIGLRFPVDDVTEPCTSCELWLARVGQDRLGASWVWLKPKAKEKGFPIPNKRRFLNRGFHKLVF